MNMIQLEKINIVAEVAELCCKIRFLRRFAPWLKVSK